MVFLLFLILFVCVLSFDSTQYDHTEVMWQQSNNLGEKEDIYTIHWSIDMKMIKIALEVNTLGWIGFGIAEQSSGTMGGSDVLQGFVQNDGNVEFKDRYVLRQMPGSKMFSAPLTDTCQDWKLISGEEMGGKTILEVSRLLDTGDSQDRPITLDGNTKIILAYGPDDELDSYHTRERRLATFLDFSGAEYKNPLDSLKNQQGIEVLDFFGHFTITTDEASIKKQAEDVGATVNIVDEVTAYMDFVMDLTPMLEEGDFHIIAVEEIIKDEGKEFVHHFVLSGLLYNGTDSPISGQGIYGWAPGVEPMVLDKCGFKISKDHIDTLALNTHYDNPHKKEGVLDTSGVRVYYTRNPPAHECGFLTIGQASKVGDEDPSIPSGKTKYVYECLDIGKDRDGNDLDWNGIPEITVFTEFLHMHEVGREQWMEVKGDDGKWIKTGNIEFWDFNFQSNTVPLIGEHKLKKGDSLRVTCIYETPPGNSTRKFGLASQDEMCLNLLVFYPRLDVLANLCGYWTDSRVTRTVETDVEFVTGFGKESLNCEAPSASPTIIEDNDNDAAISRIRSTILYFVSFSISLYWGIQ